MPSHAGVRFRHRDAGTRRVRSVPYRRGWDRRVRKFLRGCRPHDTRRLPSRGADGDGDDRGKRLGPRGEPAAPIADSTFSKAPSFDSPELDATLGWTAFNQGDLEGALERADRALATLENNPEEIQLQAHLLKGHVLTAMGRLDLAEEAWNQLAALYRP